MLTADTDKLGEVPLTPSMALVAKLPPSVLPGASAGGTCSLARGASEERHAWTGQRDSPTHHSIRSAYSLLTRELAFGMGEGGCQLVV